ncbi:adherens junction-associated protein 1 [Pontoporia blainvillei]|uniref:Adherens junction-associated protein 1 n=1 Tax=Pontoporia blainvillei TaxID=48723 RepID=A0ABX0S0Z0_PONBL|nr:adherens junction-associated protein 1 [Pontoporia blainvillei]
MLSPRARRVHRPRDQVAALGPKGGLAKPPAAAKSSPSSSAGGSGAPTDQQALLRRGKRHLQGPAFDSFDFQGSRPTTETEFIAWGPTGEEEAPESNTFPGIYGPTTVSIFQTRKTAVATATATATTATSVTLQTQGLTEPLDPRSGKPVGVSTTEPSTSPSRDSGKVSKPPRVLGETSGVSEPHQTQGNIFLNGRTSAPGPAWELDVGTSADGDRAFSNQTYPGNPVEPPNEPHRQPRVCFAGRHTKGRS